MSNFIAIGNLGKSYTTTVKSDLDTNQTKKMKMSDSEALREASKAKRDKRMGRLEEREQKLGSPEKQLENFDIMKTKEGKAVVTEATEKTNVLARMYELPEPNNPEALAHDRLYCFTCDRKLDSPNNYKQSPSASLFNDDEVRTMCCWCFGKMSDDEIKSTIKTGLEVTKEIRLAIYNPLESTKEELVNMTKDREVYLKAKIKKWKAETRLVGNVKHDYLLEGDQIENQVIYGAKTRWTACTL